MARVATCDCEHLVPNRYELVLLTAELARELPLRLAREPKRMRESRSVAALRQIVQRAADPETLRINRLRRTNDIPLLGEDTVNQLETTAGGAQAAFGAS